MADSLEIYVFICDLKIIKLINCETINVDNQNHKYFYIITHTKCP
jgi:hypothetical protein